MRSAKLIHRLAGRRRHVISAVLMTSLAALLFVSTMPQRELIVSNTAASGAGAPDLRSEWRSPFVRFEDGFDELGVDLNRSGVKVNLSAPISSPPIVAISPPQPENSNDFDNLSINNVVNTPPLFIKPNLAPSPSPSDNFDDSIEESVHFDLKIPPLVPTSVSSDSSIKNSNQEEPIDSETKPFEPQAPLWPSPADEELLSAKRELNSAPIISTDLDLHTPLFKNLSIFKRSYELMEKTLKVYIYQDGTRPIFHTPLLRGIYASEGWFMKLLQSSKMYTTKNPSKAHLFYLPYSSRQLEYCLYRPESHSIENLSVFLKNYVNMLSEKYPFWNRTKGADHFFVACHDWGPYTTKLHEEFRKNTIKALCNADTSEGIFIRGKDVSLPETFIKFPKRPHRDLSNNKPISQRTILAFFAGQMHGRVRPVLIKHWGNDKDPQMRIYARLPKPVSKKMSYIQHMKSSKFCICPMGYEVNSPRIVEAIYNGCVPVIIADHFVLPFEEVFDWARFSVVVLEREVFRLKEILEGVEERRYLELWANVQKVQRHFLWNGKPERFDLFHMVLHSVWFSRLSQVRLS
ncbi:hypothetical protein LUZ60_009810 [Juncus effusus]|nr:hypothetical protein LUZ60_009810 [Juncus effusus]